MSLESRLKLFTSCMRLLRSVEPSNRTYLNLTQTNHGGEDMHPGKATGTLRTHDAHTVG